MHAGGLRLARRRLRVAAIAILLLPAVARADASFPPSQDRAAVLAWLPTATDLAPEQVVGANPSSLIAIVSTSGEGRWRDVVVRGEALTPAAAAESRALSFQVRVKLDCVEARVRAGETEGYAARAPDGRPNLLAPADADWNQPQPGTPLHGVWSVVCDAPAATARHAAASHGSHLAQLASASTESGARSVLAHLQDRLPAGLEARVEPAQPAGRKVYRAVVAGFASHQEAEAFCATAKRNRQDCLAR